MNRKRTAIVGVVAFVCAAISFFNARSTALSEKKAQPWLSDASDSTVAMEDQFNEEMAGLITNLVDRQKSLGLALEDTRTPDEVVLEHGENVIGAHERLTRRAGEHVVALRGKLPASNRRHLMRLCAETFRGPICRMQGPGGGRGMRNGTGGGMGYGRRGAGRGPGGGRGMRHGVCDRLANCLRLDEGQVSLMHEKDPGFETEAADLRSVLLAERARLLSMFEDPESGDDQLLEQIEKLVAAHSGIERRIIRHVLVLRPYLTVEQQKWLIGLCRRSQDNS
ncbi:MAG: hypothetical protein ACYSWQ_20230 [Planctomycetota bacterium]|jgi:hypothetical protein